MRHILSLIRPIQLLLAMLTYGLGLGIAHYLGGNLQPETQYIPGLILLLVLAAANLLDEYFRPPNEPLIPGETRREREQLQGQLLTVSAVFLTVAAILAFLLQWQGLLPLTVALFLATYLLLALAISVPPARFSERGFGEIIQAFLIAVLTPAIAFLLHSAAPHRLLTVFTFPLFLLALAWMLATSFEHYPVSLKYQRHNLLLLITWQRAIPVHSGLLLTAYLFLAAAPFFGIPLPLIWPALLTLPLAGYQIFMLRNLAEGAKPVWLALNVTATAVFGLTAYLATLTFWLR